MVRRVAVEADRMLNRMKMMGLSLAIGLGGLSGCGGQPAGVAPVSASTEEASVKGTVLLRGKPVNNGYVLFSPVNIKRANVTPRQAPIGKDGSYSIKTLVGDNYVQIDCSELRQAKNREIADTERAVQVSPGENTIDLKIPPE